jgi:hypothetical protein
MPGPVNGVNLPDGSIDWSGGVDSVRVPTIQSQANPNGLQRNELAWLDNATVRDGGITPRGGYTLLGGLHNSNGIWQGGFMYEPLGANPSLVYCISGRVYKAIPGTPPQVTDLSAAFGLTMPAAQTELFEFVQAEQFLVIQTGDFFTLPLFWDGNILRRSKGITNTAVAPGTPGVNEIPAAGPMDYFMGRLWYGIGRTANAGDIVDGPSGTIAYNFSDAVLNVTENPLVVGGDGFTVPTQAGNIRAIFHNANINTALGQGNLFFGTRKAVYSLSVPVTRSDWIAAGNNNQPLMTVVQLVNGPVNSKSVVAVNGDIYYQSLEPSIRSLLASLRYWNQPGNIEIANQENRVLQFNDRALMRFGTGIEYGNRLLESALPVQTPQGVVHQAVVPLDFVPMSTFGGNQQPIWEGMYEPPPVFQMFTGDYGGLQRAFSISRSSVDGAFELWEFSEFNKFDVNRFDNQARIKWYIEFPALTWGDEMALKQLMSDELWVDRVSGTVVFEMDYRPDGEACWIPWHKWQICSASNSCEDVHNPICYPIKPFGEGYRATMTLPKPPFYCEVANRRPSDWGYQFQTRLTVTGFCRIRGHLLYADMKDRQLYASNVCGDMFKCPPIKSELPSGPIPPILLPQLFCPQITMPFSANITAVSGTPPFVYTFTGTLPTNFFITQTDSLTLNISSPSVTPDNPTNFPIVVTVTDSKGLSATHTYNIPIVDTLNPPSGTLNVPYSFQFVSGGVGPWTFVVTAGSLPTGLTLSSSGLISGTPTIHGVADWFMTITDANGCSNTDEFILSIV